MQDKDSKRGKEGINPIRVFTQFQFRASRGYAKNSAAQILIRKK